MDLVIRYHLYHYDDLGVVLQGGHRSVGFLACSIGLCTIMAFVVGSIHHACARRATMSRTSILQSLTYLHRLLIRWTIGCFTAFFFSGGVNWFHRVCCGGAAVTARFLTVPDVKGEILLVSRLCLWINYCTEKGEFTKDTYCMLEYSVV